MLGKILFKANNAGFSLKLFQVCASLAISGIGYNSEKEPVVCPLKIALLIELI